MLQDNEITRAVENYKNAYLAVLSEIPEDDLNQVLEYLADWRFAETCIGTPRFLARSSSTSTQLSKLRKMLRNTG